MKLGIMQPYFFPYLGYFHLIHQTDKWVVFDTAQYIRHGWINRNRILHPNSGWQYILIPLEKHSRELAIKDINISSNKDWKKRILGQIDHYKNKAPYFSSTREFLETCFAEEFNSICKLNVFLLQRTCDLLGIPFEYEVISEMDLPIGPVEGPGDWALRIAEAMGAKAYLNPPGGREIFDPLKFKKAGIRLQIQDFRNLEYSCSPYQFVPALSIIDVLMWNSIDRIRNHLDSQTGSW
jgi:hypothetical protein